MGVVGPIFFRVCLGLFQGEITNNSFEVAKTGRPPPFNG